MHVLDYGSQMKVANDKTETSYCLLSGRGSISFGQDYSSLKTIVESDTAIWVPRGKAHTITNSGEGPFRILVAHCKSQAEAGKTNFLKFGDIRPNEMIGLINRPVWNSETLRALGSSKTLGVDFETLTPHSVLGTHQHEEEILYLLRGEGFVRIKQTNHQVRPGSMVYTGPHVPHSVHNTSDDIFQYLVFEFLP